MEAPKKRGPYKKYLNHGTSYSIPKRTKNHWKATEKARNMNFRNGNFDCVDDPNENPIVNGIQNECEDQFVNRNVDNEFHRPPSVCDHTVLEQVNLDAPIEYISENESDQSDDGYHNYCYSSTENTEESDGSSGSDGEDYIPSFQQDSQDNVGTTSASQNDSHEEESAHDFIPILNSEQDTSSFPKDVLIRSLLILALKIRKNLDHEVITHVAELIDVITDEPLNFTSTYYLKNIVNKFTVPIDVHHCCPTCRSYIGKESILENDHLDIDGSQEEQTLLCNRCNLDVNLSQNKQSGNIFLYLSLTEQLKQFCERHHEDLSYSINREKNCSYAVEDILDGHLYKQHFTDEELQNMISINFSIDGTPLFKSSSTSITPIVCTVNEIHPQKRKNLIMLVSVYLGSKKPIMNEYVKPFVIEVEQLMSQGFTYNKNGTMYSKKCRVLMGVCDSVERPELRGSKTFRGAYGCGLCKHEGEEIAKGKGFVRVYPISDNGNAYGEGLRSHRETLIHAENTDKGIKHRSTLCDIPNFDIIKNLDVDWMHCVALGVCRQFLKLWFDSSYNRKNFYIGDSIEEIDKLLLSFKPSMDVSRTPRKISDRAHFKAHELVIWLLFYSLPVLNSFLPNKYLQHWSLLVEAISLLLKTSILETEVYYAQRCLFRFVKDIETLYGREHISFNVHLLTHLAQSVLNWGPLWSHSAFCYENYHQFIKKIVKSSNSADQQIFESIRSQIALEKLQDLLEADLTASQRKLLQKLTNIKKKPKVSTYVENIGLIGKSEIRKELPMEHYLALQRTNINCDKESSIKYYKRILINGEIIHSKKYIKVHKRNSYTVLLTNDEIFEIETFILISMSNNPRLLALGKYFKKNRSDQFNTIRLEHLYFLNLTQNLTAVAATIINQKVTFLSSPNYQISVACKHPNKIEMLT